MKKIFFIATIIMTVYSHAQTNNSVPAALMTNDSTYWTVSTVSSIGYTNTTSGPYYNNYKSGGGMLVKFKFKPNGRFEFLLYVQANTYGTDTETWTQVDGNVEFKKDIKGQNIFITHAEKGTYRITKNGKTTSRSIPKNELEDQHSGTFLWEKTNFKDDRDNIYLLMVDLEKYPNADINNPKTIDPSWVSKFHIPIKK